MTALAKDRIVRKKGSGVLLPYPVAASTKIYAGAMVALNSGGYAVPAGDTASHKVVGVATTQVDNSAGSNGDLSVVIAAGIVVHFNAASITQAMAGKKMFVVDDNTFDDGAGTNGISAGILAEYVGAAEGWLYLPLPVALNEVLGVGGGYKIARGQHTTVAAADTVVTGLATVVAAVASMDSDPGDDPEQVSATIGDQAGAPAAGSIIIKTWKNSGTDPTPLAATTFSKKVNWVAIGN